MLSTITIGIDPYITIGPLNLAWHGLTIAIGGLVGGLVAAREARRRGLDTAPITNVGMIAAIAGILGSRVFYLVEHGQLLDAGAWTSATGYTFYGGLIAAIVGIAIYMRRQGLDLAYLDAMAPGLALGYAIGRVGDVINGEHYGPATTFLLGVRNTHPDADVPNHTLAYHNGGLYEVLIGLSAFIVCMALRYRLVRPPTLAAFVIAFMSLGRFLEFFLRSDSDKLALGLETAQWVSLLLIAAAILATRLTKRADIRRRWSTPRHPYKL